MSSSQFLWFLLHDAFFSAVAAFGFAILFNVPLRALVGCAIAAAVGHALRTSLMHMGLGIEEATLAGAGLIGFISLLFARIWQAPAPVFSIPAVIPLVPGRFAYETMISVLQLAKLGNAGGDTLLLNAAVSGVKTFLILGAIAVGIAIPNLLFRREKPVV